MVVEIDVFINHRKDNRLFMGFGTVFIIMDEVLSGVFSLSRRIAHSATILLTDNLRYLLCS